MTSYLKYKPTSIPWLAEIPEHWEIRRLKLVCSFAYGDSLEATNRIPGDVPVYGSNGIVGYHESSNTLAPCIIVGRKGSSGKLIYSEDAGFAIDTTYFIDQRFTQSHLKWLYYALHCLKLDKISKDSAVPGLAREDAYDHYLPFATEIEQQRIADFLDHKTSQIDCLIEKKKALIEKLNEKRIALITQAVTKGLNPDAPMKPSGVDWLGDVPAHWDIRKLKVCIDVQGGGTPNTNVKEYWDGDIPWVSPKDMKAEYITQTQDYITELGLQESATNQIKTGAVLIVVRSGILRHSIPVAINEVPVTINQDMKALIVHSDLLLNEYLMALIYGLQKSLLPTWSKPGCTVESIELEYMMNTPIPLPPIEEQNATFFKIKGEKKQIDAMLRLANQTIECLTEYRTALITAAIIGKIDVCHIRVAEGE
jgi:type I restriction enzyme S subunit